VQLEVSIEKDGKAVGTLTLPSLKPHQRCTFGRAAEATVTLLHASISRIHAELSVDASGQVFLSDLGSGASLGCPRMTRHIGDMISPSMLHA
jgi:pSer/pThr/pTyr-binding forkhead associated (FHA) protein